MILLVSQVGFKVIAYLCCVINQGIGHVKQTSRSLAEKAEVMNGTMNNMNNGVQGITASVDESAKAVSSVAEDTSSLVSALTNIKDMSDDNMSVAQQMETEVGVFKVI